MNIIRDWFRHYLSHPQVVILIFMLIFGIIVLMTLGHMLAPVIASVVIAYLLEGIVRPVEQRGLPRILAVTLVFLVFILFLAFLVLGLMPLIFQQLVEFVQELPAMINQGQAALLKLPERYPNLLSEAEVRQIIAILRSHLTNLGQTIVSISISSVRNIIVILVYIVLMPIMVFLFLKDKSKILNFIRGFLPNDHALVSQIWEEVDKQTGYFIRGKFWEILIVWVAAYITFLILGLNYAILLSFFVGLSVIVPYVGATVMTLPVALVAYFQWGFSSEFATTLIAYTILQILDGNLLVPILLSGVVNLHPVAIIIGILVFGGIWGFWGVFFAIPLATLVHAIIKSWPRREINLEADNPAKIEDKTG